jgi:histidine triad (HIT) family protein
MPDCLFCKIIAGEIPCDQVHADDEFLAFRDINPQAPVHVLVIPRRHVAALSDLNDGDVDLMGRLQVTGARVAKELGLADSGYRFVINCGRDAAQTVPHIHLHVLGGRPMSWPPG